eukprot:TRINITY_DN10596_c1_g1_i1.p1 TRINITY_DN10596_c1_g1~~TRINITY_DN10596_c1_g1_i1.p1  ORF type:complete len:478 (-),score=113.63 TRINITY_DN10596_c1_g1_i1:164-1546(-)
MARRAMIASATLLFGLCDVASAGAGNGLRKGNPVHLEERHHEARRLLEKMEKQEDLDEVHQRALRTARRLFDFGGMVDGLSDAATWAQDTATSIQNKVVGVQEAAQLVQESNTYVTEGTQVGSEAWKNTLELGDKMNTTFEKFAPLKPVFASRDGIVQLGTNKGMLTTLVDSVKEIISSNSILQLLSTGLEKLCGIFGQLKDTLMSIMGKLGSRRLWETQAMAARRLGFSDLLSGIDFQGIGDNIMGFIGKIKEAGTNLVNIDTVLGPMLNSVGSKTTERLLEEQPNLLEQGKAALANFSGIGGISAEADKNAQAISSIIPTWQSVESTSIGMCPSVLQVKDTVGNLGCRTTKFVQDAALPSFGGSGVLDIVSGCPAEEVDQAKAVAAGCPDKPMSEGIENVLGEHAQSLGWVMAAAGVVGVGAVGGAGFFGAKKFCNSGGGDESSEESDSETSPMARRN